MPSVVPQLLMLKAEFMDKETNTQTDNVFVSYCKVPCGDKNYQTKTNSPCVHYFYNVSVWTIKKKSCMWLGCCVFNVSVIIVPYSIDKRWISVWRNIIVISWTIWNQFSSGSGFQFLSYTKIFIFPWLQLALHWLALISLRHNYHFPNPDPTLTLKIFTMKSYYLCSVLGKLL